MSREFAEWLKDLPETASCMGLWVDEKGGTVELMTDTGLPVYHEWIRGEAGDVSLIRCRKTDRVVGVHLELRQKTLVVISPCPVRVNEGFPIASDEIKTTSVDSHDAPGCRGYVVKMTTPRRRDQT